MVPFHEELPFLYALHMYTCDVVLLCTQAKLPEQYKLDVIRKKFSEITPTTVVLLQELERYNKLVKRMEVSLSNLQKVRFESSHNSKL